MAEGDNVTVFLTAAEASGDTHAANLIRALKEKLPGVRCVGVGGPRMAAAGCEVIEDVTGHASMLLDPLKKIPFYYKLVARTTAQIARIRPNVLVPVDSPTLNWHMAKGARKCGVPVMYYIAPQVWAWAPWRIRKVRRLTDHVACILPFEQDYFRSRGVAATFVGHPLYDHVSGRTQPYPAPPTDGAWRIALVPGSRSKEIARHAPAMVQAAELIRRSAPKAEFTFAAVDDRAAGLIADAAGTSLPIETGRTLEIFQSSHLALAVSGTVTLEAAYYGLPMVIFYKGSRLLNALLGWWLIKTKHFSLVNILAGGELVPELMPWYGDVQPLADAVTAQLAAPEKLAATSAALVKLTGPLRSPSGQSASAAAADLVIETMRKG